LTVRGYRHVLTRLGAVCGEDAPVSSIKSHHVNQLIGTRTGITRNNSIRHLATFFRWAMREGMASGNPALLVPRSRAAEPGRGILTVAQTAALMTLAKEKRPALVPYLALGLFAGIRPAELARLDPARIGKEWIVIDGSVAKTSDHRTVPVRENLRAWLDAYPPANPITPLSAKHLYAAIRKLCAQSRELEDAASNILAWPMDCMRHSYASYAYELTHDAALVASEMGHRGTDIFFRHYRGLVHPGDGKKFFDIVPVKEDPCSMNKK
jgi:integrase